MHVSTPTISSPSRSREYYEAFHAPLIEAAKKRKEKDSVTVVNVGCGQGHELQFLKNDPRLRIIGIDKSLNALKQSTLRNAQNVMLIHADVRRSPLSSSCADVGIAVGAMTFEPEAMLRSLHHALKPGGKCTVSFRIFSNISSRKHKPMDETLSVSGERFHMKVFDHISSMNAHLRHSDHQYYFQSLKDIERFIRTIGFVIERHDPFAYATPHGSQEQIEVFRLRKPLRPL